MEAAPQAQPTDPRAFAAELDALRKEVMASLSAEDYRHRQKIERWGRLCTALGYGTGWLLPNPVSAFLMSQGQVTRWAMIAHHTSHKGYDRVPGVPTTQTSKGFAKDWRRMIDWLDWIDPAAWHHEHDILHHYRLGEEADPDVVENNLEWLRDSDMPREVRMAIVGFFMLTWKWSYYAPNTLRALLAEEDEKAGRPAVKRSKKEMFVSPEFWKRCMLPYGLTHFVGIPALFLPLGPAAATNIWLNSAMAELMTNLHSFVIIVTNHAGDDLYAFDTRGAKRSEFYRRQVIGSVNFRTGGDWNDFLHGWLNYQIEHHLFPDLPMSQYQKIQPRVKEICERYGVPYVQESVFTRLKKTIAIAIGDTSMRREAPSAL